MTVIVHKDGVFYSDSRRSTHNGIASESVVKISRPSKRLSDEKLPKWDGEFILAVAGTGNADGISAMTKLVLECGQEAIEHHRALNRVGYARTFDCTIIVVTATKTISIAFPRTSSGLTRISKLKRNEITVVGSGSAAAELAGKFFRTDEIGLVCAAIAMSETCGGFVLIHDTNDKESETISRYYRYPRLRVAYGGLRLLTTKVGTWFNLTFPF